MDRRRYIAPLLLLAFASGCDALDDPTARRSYIKGGEVIRPPAPGAMPPPPRPPRRPVAAAGGAKVPDFLAVEEPKATPTIAEPDALSGEKKMPTDHTHWLRGNIPAGSRVAVELNGVTLGEFSGVLDRDITHSCRPGVNAIAFTYKAAPGRTAGAASSSGALRLEVVEGEHDPPRPPLLTYRRNGPPPAAASSGGVAAPLPDRETLMFTAR